MDGLSGVIVSNTLKFLYIDILEGAISRRNSRVLSYGRLIGGSDG